MIGAAVQPRSPAITSTPFMSGSPRSRITRSGGCAAATDSASAAVAAVSTSYCLTRRLIRNARRICGSSSTTSTLVTACRPYSPGAAGSETVIVRPPPGVSSAVSVPPMASVSPRESASPKPTPVVLSVSPSR
jgi:hypothetical protein